MNVQWLRTLFDDVQAMRLPKAPTFQVGTTWLYALYCSRQAIEAHDVKQTIAC